ncbi:MAG: hypothetical protein NTW96_21945, partial [Planctomycetia bacterium]|nr:hypothetical protein [Planctomycetia bacterium]
MAIKLDCPRCRKPLAVPNKKAGSYANCPECGGRFWVPAPSTAETRPAPPGAPPGAPPLAAGPSPAPPGPPVAKPPGTPPSAPPGTSPRKTVARMVTADAAASTLRLAEDGKLPELRLREDEKRAASDKKPSSMNPIVLVGVICMSVALSILGVLWEAPGSGAANDKAVARRQIQDEYFSGYANEPLEPYQECLREAQRAASRGDRAGERRLYRQVLDLLRAERDRFDKGLTGSRDRD